LVEHHHHHLDFVGLVFDHLQRSLFDAAVDCSPGGVGSHLAALVVADHQLQKQHLSVVPSR
jgi:hypothetical protein